MANAPGEDRSDFQAGGLSWSRDVFGFTKATEGTGWLSSTFPGNWARLKAQGKHRGAYHFFHPAESASAQAQFFISYVRAHGGISPGDMFACDAEISIGADGAEVAEPPAMARIHAPLLRVPEMAAYQDLRALVGSGALAFCNEVSRLVGSRCPVLLYTYLSFRGLVADCVKYPLWIADYSSSPPGDVSPWHRWMIWQDSGTGGQGGGDHNWFNGDAAAMRAWLDSYQPAPAPAEEEDMYVLALPASGPATFLFVPPGKTAIHIGADSGYRGQVPPKVRLGFGPAWSDRTIEPAWGETFSETIPHGASQVTLAREDAGAVPVTVMFT